MYYFDNVQSWNDLRELTGYTITGINPLNEDEESGIWIDLVDSNGNKAGFIYDGKDVSVNISKNDKCPSCNNKNIGGAAVFCSRCGHDLSKRVIDGQVAWGYAND